MLRRFGLTILALLLCSITLPLRAESPVVSGDVDALLTQYKGKVVLLDFWASWCEPCRQSFPWMNELQTKYGPDGLVIVAVNLDQDVNLAAQFLAASPAHFRIAYDRSGASATRFEVTAMPSSVVIDRAGQIRERHRGFKPAQRSAREQELVRLLRE